MFLGNGISRPAGCWAAIGAAALLACCGCGAFRARMPVPESVSRCRTYSCQGVTALERGDCQQAELYLRQAVKASPEDADARRHLAEALWTRGDRDGAIEHLRAAAVQEPHHAPTVCRLGQMEAETGAWGLAKQRAEQAQRDSPRLASAWALRGRALLETGDPQRAKADFFRALEFAPNDRDVLTDLAQLYAQQEKPERWLATVHQLQDTYPHGEAPPGTRIMEANAYVALGRPHDAADLLRVAAEQSPGDPAVWHRLAQAEETVGRHAAAIAAAHRALALDGGHLPSRQLLARLNSQTNGLH